MWVENTDQSQAVQTWIQMGTSDWLEGRSAGSSHLPPSTQVLVEISSLGRSGVTGPCWLSLIVPFPRWVLVLSSGLPVRSRVLFTWLCIAMVTVACIADRDATRTVMLLGICLTDIVTRACEIYVH